MQQYPVTPNRPIRPSPKSTSTTSSTESVFDDVFDSDVPLQSSAGSPLTPPDDKSNPFKHTPTTHRRHLKQILPSLHHAARKSRKRLSTDLTAVMPIRLVRHLGPDTHIPGQFSSYDSSDTEKTDDTIHEVEIPIRRTVDFGPGWSELKSTGRDRSNSSIVGHIRRIGEADSQVDNVVSVGFWSPNFQRFHKKSKTLLTINNSILKYLQQPHSRKEVNLQRSRVQKSGWVYILQDRNKSHVKIGITLRDPDTRLEELEKCHIQVTILSDTKKDAFDNFNLVETIIKKELCNTRKKFACQKCGKVHGEWYEATSEEALKTVKRWQDWMKNYAPYQAGTLTPYWEWRARRLKYTISSVNWSNWTQPNLFDYYLFKFEEFNGGAGVGLRAHFSTRRKDERFWVRGMFVGVVLMLVYGRINEGLFCFLALLVI